MSITSLRRATRESFAGLPREFWWLWTSTLVNRLGGFVATFLAMYLTVDRGYSATYAGLVAALYGLGGVVSSVGAGVMTDRLGRRPTLLASQLGTSASVAVLGFMEDPVAIAVVACLVGMTSNASRPAVQAMMADIVAPADRIRAFALNYWAINLGFAVSATAAGLIAEHGYLLLFLGEATLTAVCAVLVFARLPESRPDRTPDRAPADDRTPGGDRTPAGDRASGSGGPGDGVLGGGSGRGADVGKGAGAGTDAGAVSMWTVLGDGRFMAVVALNYLLATIFLQAYVTLPVAMAQDGLGSSDYGLAIAGNGVLIILLQIPVTRFIEHRDPSRLLVLSSLLAGYGFGLTAFAGSTALYALTILVWTLGEIINSPTQMGLVVRLSPVHGRGRYQGMYTLSWSVAALTAPLAGGVVLDRWGADTLWTLTAAVGTLAALGYWLLLRPERATRPAAGTVPAPPLVPAPRTVTVAESPSGPDVPPATDVQVPPTPPTHKATAET